MNENTSFFSKKLILWYLENRRDLPWRRTSNPYFIWLSEIILQQTRVDQGLPYYLKFVEIFPTINNLADADESTILKLWQGLGYYSRARNLHETAKYIVRNYDGIFPSTYDGLIELKGVGDYTASAIGSICFDLPNAVVDGNVYRVLSRVFGIETAINSSAGVKEFKALAQHFLDDSQPGVHNQAIMEFGARFCTPRNPPCSKCCIQVNCEASNSDIVSRLPVKRKLLKVKRRYFNYLVFLSENGKTLLRQRNGKGIWEQLYEFPLVETRSVITISQLQKQTKFEEYVNDITVKSVSLYNEKSVLHKLSHQHLVTRFWIVEVLDLKEEGIPLINVKDYAVPVLIENFISSFSLLNN